MKTWDRTSVVDWLKETGEETIVVKMQGTTLRVEGKTMGVDKIDACSTEIEEVEMDMGQDNINISFSIHDNTLSIHFLANQPGTNRVSVSMPVSIPYGLLTLLTVEEEKEEKRLRLSGGRPKEPEFSPYELLR